MVVCWCSSSALDCSYPSPALVHSCWLLDILPVAVGAERRSRPVCGVDIRERFLGERASSKVVCETDVYTLAHQIWLGACGGRGQGGRRGVLDVVQFGYTRTAHVRNHAGFDHKKNNKPCVMPFVDMVRGSPDGSPDRKKMFQVCMCVCVCVCVVPTAIDNAPGLCIGMLVWRLPQGILLVVTTGDTERRMDFEKAGGMPEDSPRSGSMVLGQGMAVGTVTHDHLDMYAGVLCQHGRIKNFTIMHTCILRAYLASPAIMNRTTLLKASREI